MFNLVGPLVKVWERTFLLEPQSLEFFARLPERKLHLQPVRRHVRVRANGDARRHQPDAEAAQAVSQLLQPQGARIRSNPQNKGEEMKKVCVHCGRTEEEHCYFEAKMPNGCVCPPGDWGDTVTEVCDYFTGSGPQCTTCEHDKECHVQSARS
jgi:hypothetical protein